MKRLGAIAGVLFLLGLALAPAVMGSVPKVVILEEFGATW
jgi:hypothetical protein